MIILAKVGFVQVTFDQVSVDNCQNEHAASIYGFDRSFVSFVRFVQKKSEATCRQGRRLKTTFCGKTTFGVRRPSLKGDLQWKTDFGGRQPFVGRRPSVGRQPLVENDLR